MDFDFFGGGCVCVKIFFYRGWFMIIRKSRYLYYMIFNSREIIVVKLEKELWLGVSIIMRRFFKGL